MVVARIGQRDPKFGGQMALRLSPVAFDGFKKTQHHPRHHLDRAFIKVLDKPHLDLTTPLGRGFIAFLSAMAEDERQRIVKRANDGRIAAASEAPGSAESPNLPCTSNGRS